jgi:hypothetical protein
MVRPVEPDPPDALRRTNDCVKRAEATPDSLGHRQVKERQEQAGEHSENEPGDRVDVDLVIIGGREEGAASGEGDRSAPSSARPDPGQPKSDHVDVKG